jgi:hypothetical protein
VGVLSGKASAAHLLQQSWQNAACVQLKAEAIQLADVGQVLANKVLQDSHMTAAAKALSDHTKQACCSLAHSAERSCRPTTKHSSTVSRRRSPVLSPPAPVNIYAAG